MAYGKKLQQKNDKRQEYSRNYLSEKEKQQMPEEKTNVQHHLIPGFSKC